MHEGVYALNVAAGGGGAYFNPEMFGGPYD